MAGQADGGFMESEAYVILVALLRKEVQKYLCFANFTKHMPI